ncbi:UPF0711 protein C18orf21 homolog isoform X2 [Trichomycterus rosablanca]
MKAPFLPDTVLCPFCYQWRQPGEYRVRLRPKRRPTVQIEKLLRKEAACKRLSTKEMKLLQKFRRSSSILITTCHTCNKTSRHVGMNRDFLSALPKPPHTPSSAVKCKTPHSANKTPKSGVQEKTPCRTPGSQSSETPSSSKSASGKKSAFSRLKKLLMLEDSQKSKKGGLKDFLTSL